MKDETIRPGDLVMVAYDMPCCGRSPKWKGRSYYVGKVIERFGLRTCSYCFHSTFGATFAHEVGTDTGCNISILKKIHPPELPETVDERQEVEA